MRPNYHILNLCAIVVMVLSAVLTQGCIKEDNRNCGISVMFTYTKNIDRVNKFSTNIKTIDLYVYDVDGDLVGIWPANASSDGFLPTDFSIKIPTIKPGIYTLVAWGNQNEQYMSVSSIAATSTTTPFNNSALNLRVGPGTDRAAPSLGDDFSLFHGCMTQIVVERDYEGTQLFTMDLTKFSNFIEVTMTGLPVGTATSSSIPFNCYIVSKNGDYRFNGTFASDHPVTYYPSPVTVQSNGTTIVSEFSTLRELNSNVTDSYLIVTHTLPGGTLDILAEVPLVELLINIAGDPNNFKNTGNLDIDDEFHIVIEFNYTYNTVNITIKGWDESIQISKPLY